jgi:uncharacterized protein YjbI with pentapeptide repeats
MLIMSEAATGLPFDEELPPSLATIAPRVRRPGSVAALAIEEMVVPLLWPGARGLVVIIGPPGSGKTTALRHLRKVLPADALATYHDAGPVSAALAEASRHLVIMAAEAVDPAWNALEVFEIGPWTPDDHVEYLAKVHRESCPSVLHRLRADESLPSLHGSPQLLTLVMDRMAADPALSTSHDALKQLIPLFFPFDFATERLVNELIHPSAKAGDPAPPDNDLHLRPDQQRWWRHEVVRKIVATEWIVDQLGTGRRPDVLKTMAGRMLLPQIARAVRPRADAMQHLERLIQDEPRDFRVPMAASILLAVNPDWRPACARGMYLRGASLRLARWAGINLTGAALMGADFTDANLSGAMLTGAAAAGVRMPRANLRGTRLDHCKLREAIFTGADLSDVSAERADLSQADFSSANLISASMPSATLSEANLTGACLCRVKLCEATMMRVLVDGADCTGADLARAHLDGVRMNEATWTGASFRSAQLRNCVLEWMELPDADFVGADLTGSLMTGSQIPRGQFEGAILRHAGLADIDWEGADLRSVDFAHCSFHLGSTRSGLVGSTVPSEGSRTGFYTDEFNEQDFKAPEEIRKACLCGADLCGAEVEDADFYLVDLRGAKYTEAQREFFIRCGAILESRIA